MKRYRIAPLLVAATWLMVSVGQALPHAHADSASYNVSMNWFPEPEEGGFYYADHMGLYKKYGINTTIRIYGFSVNGFTDVLSGKIAFAMGNADEVLQYRSRGAPLVAIMNTFQVNPQGFLWHAEDKSIHSLADFSNHTIIYAFGVGYFAYLQKHYHWTNIKTRNYDFTSRAFALDPKAVNQCYVTSEPYVWGKQGLKVKYDLIASSGYDPYGDLIVTTESMVKNHPDLVRAFVKASVEGWYSYLKDPSATNTYMLTAPGAKNYPLKPDEMAFDFNQVKRLKLVNGGDAATHGIGYFSLARWKTLQQQMVSTGQKVGKVDVTQAFTNQFLPGK
jgi:NitT/TauT family transport system substrate-binding protein